MEFTEVIKGRRSIRKYEDKPIDEAVLREIAEMAAYAPSWKNVQPTSYIAITDSETKAKIAESCGRAYEFNGKTTDRAAAVIAVVTQKGISGFEKDGSFSTSKEDRWEVFDAGIATQTFCLSAYEKGVGTCIIGIFNEDEIKEILGLSDDYGIAAIIAAGYPEKEPAMPPRKSVDELIKIV